MKRSTLYTYENRVTGTLIRDVAREPEMVNLRIYRLVGFRTVSKDK